MLGKKLEAVVVDPASNWPLFAEKARELITKNKVAVVFGCWTSVSRKSVLPVFKELNSILFYPVQYEGEESERNVFYTGAAPNQQAIPAVDYLAKDEKVERWVLAGTDYVYPRTTNKILEAYLKSKGVAQEDIMLGALFILVTLFLPKGIVGTFNAWWEPFKAGRAADAASAAAEDGAAPKPNPAE